MLDFFLHYRDFQWKQIIIFLSDLISRYLINRGITFFYELWDPWSSRLTKNVSTFPPFQLVLGYDSGRNYGIKTQVIKNHQPIYYCFFLIKYQTKQVNSNTNVYKCKPPSVTSILKWSRLQIEIGHC